MMYLSVHFTKYVNVLVVIFFPFQEVIPTNMVSTAYLIINIQSVFQEVSLIIAVYLMSSVSHVYRCFSHDARRNGALEYLSLTTFFEGSKDDTDHTSSDQDVDKLAEHQMEIVQDIWTINVLLKVWHMLPAVVCNCVSKFSILDEGGHS